MKHIISILIATFALTSTINCLAANKVIVESRKADGTPNTPAWSEISGKWGRSKNKSEVAEWSGLVATNVTTCVTNTPTPSFKVSPEGLEPGTNYKVDVTFSTTSTHVAAPDLIVAVSIGGVSKHTIAETTEAFKGANADSWTSLGSITPSTDHPTLTFTYESGTLSKTSRWYVDAIRFTPQIDSQ